MKFSKIWQLALGILLVFWGALLMDWISFDNANDVLGIGAIVVGALAIIDK
jgi:uncharacterized membrane protein